MNRKKFLERISMLSAGGMMSAAFSDKMAPRLSKDIIYEANPKIVAELVAGKIYTLNSQVNLK